MPRGTVKWFDENKGYGYIERPGQSDVRVDYAASGFRTLKQGAEVDFELIKTERGPQACNVVRLKPTH